MGVELDPKVRSQAKMEEMIVLWQSLWALVMRLVPHEDRPPAVDFNTARCVKGERRGKGFELLWGSLMTTDGPKA